MEKQPKERGNKRGEKKPNIYGNLIKTEPPTTTKTLQSAGLSRALDLNAVLTRVHHFLEYDVIHLSKYKPNKYEHFTNSIYESTVF